MTDAEKLELLDIQLEYHTRMAALLAQMKIRVQAKASAKPKPKVN
jgi:hypothetical protein